MKKKTSGTAEGVAFIRYYESRRPQRERICNDYMAYGLSAWWIKASAIICRIFPTAFMDRALEKKEKGFCGFIAVRTRLFDDYVLDCIKNGVRQYVILGAGLDSRPYRFAEDINDIKVFEIDHPSSQTVKRKRIEKYIGTPPSNVRYVPVDFTRDNLLQSLKDAGYDASLKTVFTFEGVTMYLDSASVKETLLFVINNSGPGSSIMFDYIYKEVLDGTMRSKIISRMNNLKSLYNEPVIFGIGRGKAESYVRDIGFDKIDDFSSSKLYEKYIKTAKLNRTISDNFAVVLAVKK